MDKKIIFQKCSFNFIYFVLYFVMFFIDINLDYINIYNYNEENQKNLPYYNISSRLLFTYMSILSNFLATIPYLIKKKYEKKQKDNEKDISDLKTDNNKDVDTQILIFNSLYENEKYKRTKISKFYSFLTSLFEFLSKISIIVFYMIFPDDLIDIYWCSFDIPYRIILLFIFSYFILKMHFYRLHYFTLFLSVIIFIIILTFDLLNIFYYDSADGKYYIIEAVLKAFEILEYSYGKKLLLYGFVSPYYLLIMKGIYEIFMLLIFSIIVLIVEKNIFVEMAEFFVDIKSIILLISKLIVYFFKELFLWLIMDRFSPNHFSLALILEEIFYFILDIIFDEVSNYIIKWDLYIRIFLFIILFIGVMIHNEVMIINICGLGSYTKYFLDLIVKNEEIYTKEDDPDVIKKYETFVEMDDKYDDISVNGKLNEIN